MAAKTSANKSSTKASSNSKSSAVTTKTKHNRNALAVLGLLIIFFVLVYLFRGFFVAANVNGQEISRYAVVKSLEKQGGQQTLDSMITKALILQEAKKRNMSVSNAEINAEIQKITKSLTSSGTTLNQALEAQGMTRKELNEEIRLQLLVQKLVGNNTKLSEKEIEDFIKQNESQFPEGTSEKAMRDQATAQLKQQKAQLETQSLIKKLKDNSKTIYFIRY